MHADARLTLSANRCGPGKILGLTCKAAHQTLAVVTEVCRYQDDFSACRHEEMHGCMARHQHLNMEIASRPCCHFLVLSHVLVWHHTT